MLCESSHPGVHCGPGNELSSTKRNTSENSVRAGLKNTVRWASRQCSGPNFAAYKGTFETLDVAEKPKCKGALFRGSVMHTEYNLETVRVLLRIASSFKKKISCFDARQEGRIAPGRPEEGKSNPQRIAVTV